MDLKLHYKKIGGTEPNSSEILDVARNGSKTSIGHIRKDGSFWPSAGSASFSVEDQALILGVAIRFSRNGRVGVPEATHI